MLGNCWESARNEATFISVSDGPIVPAVADWPAKGSGMETDIGLKLWPRTLNVNAWNAEYPSGQGKGVLDSEAR